MHHSSANPCACTALRKASRALTRLYDERLAPHGLTTTQFALLRNIDREGEISLSALAELLVMDRTSLYRTIRPAEREGWVEIAPAERGNVSITRLTAAGRKIMRAAEPAWEAVQAEVQEGLGERGWQGLARMTAQVVALAKE